jgi:hypothetical protein
MVSRGEDEETEMDTAFGIWIYPHYIYLLEVGLF